MSIKGEIRAREELVVDGEVEGLLESQSLITVGPSGNVKANIQAREMVIYGSVRGNVEVSEKIAIREQGSLIGDIKSAGISIDDGAYFKGNIDIIRPEPKPVKMKTRRTATPSRAVVLARRVRRPAKTPYATSVTGACAIPPRLRVPRIPTVRRMAAAR